MGGEALHPPACLQCASGSPAPPVTHLPSAASRGRGMVLQLPTRYQCTCVSWKTLDGPCRGATPAMPELSSGLWNSPYTMNWVSCLWKKGCKSLGLTQSVLQSRALMVAVWLRKHARLKHSLWGGERARHMCLVRGTCLVFHSALAAHFWGWPISWDLWFSAGMSAPGSWMFPSLFCYIK